MLKYILLFFLSINFTFAGEVHKLPIFPGTGDLIYTDTLLINNVPVGTVMVDTGASMMLVREEEAELYGLKYVDDIQLHLADGSSITSKVYYAETIHIGECKLTNVVVSTLPNLGKQDAILGINVLSQVSPFGFALIDEDPFMFIYC